MVKFSELEARSSCFYTLALFWRKNINGAGRLWEVEWEPLLVTWKIQCQMITSVCDSSKVYGSITHSIWIPGMSKNSMLKVSIRKNLNSTFVVKSDLRPSKLRNNLSRGQIIPILHLLLWSLWCGPSLEINSVWSVKWMSLWSVDLQLLGEFCWVELFFWEQTTKEFSVLGGVVTVLDWFCKRQNPKSEVNIQECWYSFV